MEWKDTYPKNRKPAYNELLDFFQSHIRELFLSFDSEMHRRFNVHNKYHRYLPTAGWVYGYGRSYSCELLAVAVWSDCFNVLGISVMDDNSLRNALEKTKKVYEDGFEERYAAICAKKRGNQIERSKKRVEREKTEMDKLIQSVDPDKLNKFKWCKKVSRGDLHRLYQSEAKGLINEELLDEIGYTFYTRCSQSKEALPLLNEGRILCHHCGTVVKATGYASITYCECGYCYTYREYRRSFNTSNMPAHRAQPIFDAFVEKWPGCEDTAQKMLLIDWLIHECHVTLMSGEKGRSVCVNLIEGTKKQISDLIIKLTYGGGEEK